MRRKKMAVAMLALCLAAGNMMTSLAGWQQLEDKNWKYQNENQSWKADSWFQDVDGKWYHFNKDGLMDKGWFLDADGKWYFLADNGSMQTGLHNVDGRVYYFNPSGDMLMGDKEIYGRVYTFGLYGAENGTPYTPNKWNGAGQQVQTGGGYSSDDDDDSSGSGDNGGSYPDDEKPDPPSGGGVITEEIKDISGLYPGTERRVLLKLSVDNAQITVKSGSPAVAGVWMDGSQIVIRGLAAGTAVITVTASAQGYETQTMTFTVTVAEQPVETEDGRQVFNFNTGWQFSKGVGKNNNQSEVKPATDVVVIPESEKPWETDYVMGDSWSKVSLPHTYNDVDTFDNFMEEEGSHHGERSMYTGTAWYRKDFTVPESYAGKKVFLEFEAARQAAHMYVNGQLLDGVSENGFIPFGYDLTPYLKFGEENQITVMVDNSFPYYAQGTTDALSWHDSHWHPTHGGLYRNANLYVTDKLHVTLPLYSFLETQGTYVYTSDETESSAVVHVEAEIQNEYDVAKTFRYTADILDMDGQSVANAASGDVTLNPGEKTIVKVEATVDDPIFWSDAYPYLYQAESGIVLDGEEVDISSTTFGIRIFRLTNDFGMYLNEHYIKLQGWGQKSTNEWAGLGAAYPDWMHDFVIKLMKDGGGNFIRWGHTAGSPTQIELSDKYGLLVEQPGVDGEGSTVGGVYSDTAYAVRKNAFRDMIIYFRNSPSIIMWELGNQSMPDKEAKSLSELIYEYDSHGRGSAPRVNTGAYDGTTASSQRLISVRRGNGTMAKYVDVGITTEGSGGMNTSALGSKPEVEGEYNREEARRGVWDRYTEGFEDYKMVSGTYNLTQEQFAVNQVSNYKKISKVSHNGGANWIFSDSTSHGRVYSEVTRASGEVDAVMLEKEAYYTLQTIQTDEIDAYIVGHWNYPAGTKKNVYVASDADSVELFLNDVSLGKGTRSDTYLFTFSDVEYEPGTLTAVGYDLNGAEACRTLKSTHGEPAAVRLTAIEGPQGLLANGSDVLLIDAEVVDSNGNRCLNYDGENLGTKIHFTINDGNGCSIWRGGYNSGVEHSTNEKSLYIEAGITRVAVRTTTKPGDITVTGSIDGLASDSISVESQEVDNVNGLSTTYNETMEYDLGALTYPGLGDGSKPNEQTNIRKGYTSLLVDNFSYSGTETKIKPGVENPAALGQSVYTDEEIVFDNLPLYLVNEDYLKLPNADSGFPAEDMVSFGALNEIDVYVAHDDRISTPDWLEGTIQGITFRDTNEDITIDGQVYSLHKASASKGQSVTLSSNAPTTEEADKGNMYVVFITAQGHDDEFFQDDFEANGTVGVQPGGWKVNTAENTEATVVNGNGGKCVQLKDSNTADTDNLVIMAKEFLPQSGKFSVEWSICDKRAAGQNFVRFIVHDGAPKDDPGDKDGFVVESYLNTGGNLIYRQGLGTTNKIIMNGLEQDKWYRIKYVVDMEEKKFDAYVDGVLKVTGGGFGVEAGTASCFIIGTGAKTGTDIMVDNVKVEVLEDRLESINVNGEDFTDLELTGKTITLPLPADFDTNQVPVIQAEARSCYAEVEITQPSDFSSDGTIKVTPLTGDAVTYTLKFGTASEEPEDILLEEDFEGGSPGDKLSGDWTVWTDDSKTKAVIATDTVDGGQTQVLHLQDTNAAAASGSDNMALIAGAFDEQTGKVTVEYRIKDQKAKAARYFRIILHSGEPDIDPNKKDGFLVETYINDGSLVYRTADDPSTNVTIGAIQQNQWYAIKYVVDMEAKSYDVYMDNVRVKSGLKFRNDLTSVDHIIFATGGKYEGDFLLDDIRVTGSSDGTVFDLLAEPMIEDIQINGKSLPDFDPVLDTYEVTVPEDTEKVEVRVATASEAVKTVTVNGQTCKGKSATVQLEDSGDNVITVEAENKAGDSCSYAITVIREEEEIRKPENNGAIAGKPENPDGNGTVEKPDTEEPEPGEDENQEGTDGKPDDGEKPDVGEKPDEGTDPDEGEKPDEGTDPDEGEKPDEGTDPDEGEKPDEGTDPDGGTKPDGGTNPDGGTEPDEETAPDEGTKPDEGGKPDGGTKPDSGTTPDGATKPDGGTDPDGGMDPDGETKPDGGAAPDSGANPDSGTAADGGITSEA